MNRLTSSLPKSLPWTAAAVTATAAAGGLVTDPQSSWYRGLDLPPWQPPGPTFGIVWTPLYASIAGAGAVTIDRLRGRGQRKQRASFERALAVNLALNAGWSITFFGAKRPAAASVVAAFLAASSADLARRATAAGPGPAIALTPYAAWTSFAAVLSYSIWPRNR